MPARSQDNEAADRLIGTLGALWDAALLGWRLVVAITFAAAAASVIVVLLIPRLYRSSASFVPERAETTQLPSAVLGVLSRLNLGGDASQSPLFYVELLRSRPVLDRILLERPHHACSAEQGRTVLEQLNVSGTSRADSLFYGRRRIAERIHANLDIRTGIVRVSVDAACAALAVELVDSLLAALNHFNVETRQSNAKTRRTFAERRAAEGELELQEAEQELEEFFTRNRVWESSPELSLVHDRLQRRVAMRQDVAVTLLREFETARLDEANSVPVITVLEPPDLPIRPFWPPRRLVVIVTTLFGAALGVTLAVLRALLSAPPSGASRRLHRLQSWTEDRRRAWAGEPSG